MMKELLILISAILLIGCDTGSGSGSAPAAPEAPAAPAEPEMPQGIEKMKSGETYQVTHGDYIVKTTEEAQIRVTHKGGEANSSIELVQGEANIVRKQ